MLAPHRARSAWVSWLRLPQLAGMLGMSRLPGLWMSSLARELDSIRTVGTSTLVSLTESKELRWAGTADFGAAVARAGLCWYHLPIRDFGTPDARFETAWAQVSPELYRRLASAERIVIHCYAGLGRTGLVAARMLIEQGESFERALALVRAARPGAVQTAEQEAYLRRLASGERGSSA